jgi:uncharacterized protein with FMN-binding domain
MKRAVLALLATVAGLVFILSFKPTPVTAELPPIVIADDGPGKPPVPKKFFPKKDFPQKDFSTGAEADLAGLPDGSYTGDAVDIPGGHGLLQVSLTVDGGQVVDVQAAHQPTSPHSEQISGQALPVLREEVLTTQQGPVDVVSGATAVSKAFNASLLSAVD